MQKLNRLALRCNFWPATALAAVVALACFLMNTRGGKPSHGQAPAFAAALLELHGEWTTNGSRLVPRNGWPASVKALQVNGVEVNRFSAYAYRRDFLGGFWWSSGYEIRRQQTNDSTWSLYQVSSWGGRGIHGPRWRSLVNMVTNVP